MTSQKTLHMSKFHQLHSALAFLKVDNSNVNLGNNGNGTNGYTEIYLCNIYSLFNAQTQLN